MAVTDWRAWVAQQGGLQPPQTPPTMFPGVLPITDFVQGTTSVPVTPSIAFPNNTNTPTTVPAVDPWAGWNAQQERLTNTMRPVVAGITS
jgi:hypothetical protein